MHPSCLKQARRECCSCSEEEEEEEDVLLLLLLFPFNDTLEGPRARNHLAANYQLTINAANYQLTINAANYQLTINAANYQLTINAANYQLRCAVQPRSSTNSLTQCLNFDHLSKNYIRNVM
jgi:hypothetical protein